jgi:hypothetical protein
MKGTQPPYPGPKPPPPPPQPRSDMFWRYWMFWDPRITTNEPFRITVTGT